MSLLLLPIPKENENDAAGKLLYCILENKVGLA
jgi:hypothetical protein